jgi:hypothetical protein
MKPIRLRSYGDPYGTTVDVVAYCAPREGQAFMDRLSEVAQVIKNNSGRDGDEPQPGALVTSIETNFAAGHIAVTAVVPEGKNAERVQRALLAMMAQTPPSN